MKLEIFKALKTLASHRKYVTYSLAYGLSSLILPFGIQFLVNNLALSGIWFNTISFLLVIGIGLFISQIVKHSQVILVETLQREIMVAELERWKNLSKTNLSHYFFEVPSLLKSFSKAYTHLIELSLLIIFGLITIVLFHPVFLLIPILIAGTLYHISKSFQPSIASSIIESDEKYGIYEDISLGRDVTDEHVDLYLEARDKHFSFTKMNSLKVSTLSAVCQILLLGSGSYLIQLEQLSVGQLVSAEIIISGISISLLKLPETLESVFDYETSQYKISKAIQGASNE